jgi:hypothetical protein
MPVRRRRLGRVAVVPVGMFMFMRVIMGMIVMGVIMMGVIVLMMRMIVLMGM